MLSIYSLLKRLLIFLGALPKQRTDSSTFDLVLHTNFKNSEKEMRKQWGAISRILGECGPVDSPDYKTQAFVNNPKHTYHIRGVPSSVRQKLLKRLHRKDSSFVPCWTNLRSVCWGVNAVTILKDDIQEYEPSDPPLPQAQPSESRSRMEKAKRSAYLEMYSGNTKSGKKHFGRKAYYS